MYDPKFCCISLERSFAYFQNVETEWTTMSLAWQIFKEHVVFATMIRGDKVLGISSCKTVLFLLIIKSHFGNMCTFLGQQKFLELGAISAENKTQYHQTKDYPWLPFKYFLESWKPFCLVYVLPLFFFPFSLDYTSGVSCMHKNQVDDSWM